MSDALYFRQNKVLLPIGTEAQVDVPLVAASGGVLPKGTAVAYDSHASPGHYLPSSAAGRLNHVGFLNETENTEAIAPRVIVEGHTWGILGEAAAAGQYLMVDTLDPGRLLIATTDANIVAKAMVDGGDGDTIQIYAFEN